MNETQPTSIVPANQLTHRSADNDEQLVSLWLHGLSRHTQRAYLKDSSDFRQHVSKPFDRVTLLDIQGFAHHLAGIPITDGTRHRALAAVKSLFSFGHEIGYLPFNTAKPLRVRGSRETLHERILDEQEVRRLIAADPRPRNQTLLKLLYLAGLRVSEAAALKWRDLHNRGDSGQITVVGKGNKTRAIRLTARVWFALLSIRSNASEDCPVFLSRKGGHLDTSAILRIVKAAGRRAGINKTISPHFFRHAHASHALDRGAPLHLVQATLGHSSVATTGRYLHARPTASSSDYLLG